MNRKLLNLFVAGIVLTMLPVIERNASSNLSAKQKPDAVDTNDATLRLYQLLDGSYGGKLEDFYLLADIYPDPKTPGQELQRVLRLEYDKARTFGKMKLYVRNVAKMQPEQLKSYSPKMVYEFGVEDTEKFVKTEPGQFGKIGDLYLLSTEEHPLATSPITDGARKTYTRLLNDHLLPALQKK